jgi:hypothetical protein
MKKKILGIIVVILGLVLLGVSFYITSQTKQGQKEVSQAQKKVEKGKSLFSVTPVTKEIGKGLGQIAQSKINKALEKIKKYNNIAFWFMVGGIILIVVGLGIIFINRRRRL